MKFIEVFSTWQGEGPDVGKRMLLVRFKRCNLFCKWCDTLVKMRSSVEAEYSIEQLQTIIDEEKLGLMITGGEPTFGDNFNDTLDMCQRLRVSCINIETNGHKLLDLFKKIHPILKVNQSKSWLKFIYSPKLFTQQDYINSIELSKTFVTFPNFYFKFVYTSDDESYNNRNDIVIQKLIEMENDINNRIYLMPEGKTKEELLKSAPIVFDKCEEWKVNFSSREHIIYSFV